MTATEKPTLRLHDRVGQTSGLPVAGTSGSQSAKPNSLVSGLHSRGALPHLKREGASYFVTFRLAGTLPREVLLRLKREREAILEQARAQNRPLTWPEQIELFNWYSERVDKYLDAGHGECCLGKPVVAELVATALRYFAGQRYELHAWVVMPNHVHVVLRPHPPHTLSAILKSWKSYTAVHANRILQRSGKSFWQSESYDHWCRDDDDLARCCAYTTMNPVTARLCAHAEDWPWSSLHVGQTSGLPAGGTSGSVDDMRARNPAPGLRSKPQPSGQRPDPRYVPGRPRD
jgi:REP element-mobilizing transposase RayT